eukprot:TRINITY_DN1931_c0_g1_i1.p1 TRINITY_DN1931_c0_g1~~TRINITY_DN1931_c0_g1_i1.p1  ORF type:complete len:185 (-),score=53.69 TRINITY_DN1931_c0_g1_i1:294-848(-)
MAELGSHLNESIKRYENQMELLQISEMMKSPTFQNLQLVEPHRKFIKQGPLMKVCRKAIKQRWVFLFNDLLVYCTDNPFGGYLHHLSIKLFKTKIEDVPDQESKGWFNAFKVISAQKSFVVLATSPEEKKNWMTAIQTAISDLKNRKDSLQIHEEMVVLNEEAPVWEQDQDKAIVPFAPPNLLC